MSGDFDNNNDFDDLNDDGFDDFKSGGNALKEVWQNNPLLKIAVIIVGLIIVITVIVILTSGSDIDDSYVKRAPTQSDAPGGEVSQSYADAIVAVNEDRKDQAMQNPDISSVPIPYNLQDQDLLSETNEGPPYEDFDPLAAWRQQAEPELAPEPEQEEPILAPYEGPIAPQPVPGPSPDVVNSLAQAMSAQMGDILGEHGIMAPRIMQVTGIDYLTQDLPDDMGGSALQMVDTDGDGIPDTVITAEESGEVIVETILIPAGTINYAQMLTEANSDVPGPILAQLVSGPLAGARLIGTFRTTDEYLILTFNSIVIDGLNQSINAVAIDPDTTLPGVATEVDKRYWSRVLLPAAAEFIAGVGSAIAQDSSTTVTVNGETVTTSRSDLTLKEELGQGVEAAADEVADFMDDEANGIRPLVRVARGTPIGIFFTQPVLEQE